MIKLTICGDNCTVSINIERTKLLKYEYFKDINTFQEIQSELTINNDDPINLAKAIIDPSITKLANSLNLLGSTKILDFFKVLNKKDKMNILKYYSNIDPKIWFKLCQDCSSELSNKNILSTLNSYNLTYYIENTHDIDIDKYIEVANTVPMANNDYIKILQGKLEVVEGTLSNTENKKLLNLYFCYCAKKKCLKRAYILFENNNRNLLQLLLYIKDNVYSQADLSNFCMSIQIKYYSTKGINPLKNFKSENKYPNYNGRHYINIDKINEKIIDCVCTKYGFYMITEKTIYKLIFINGEYIPTQIDCIESTDWTSNHDITNYCVLDNGILAFDENCTNDTKNTLYLDTYYEEDPKCDIFKTDSFSSKSYLKDYYMENDNLYKLSANIDLYGGVNISSELLEYKNNTKLNKLIEIINYNFNDSYLILKKALSVLY